MSDPYNYRDCLYSVYKFTFDNYVNDEQHLIPYCIKHNVPSSRDDIGQCYENTYYTFEQLKAKNIDSHDLYRWNAPIDTINNYEKYRTGHSMSLGSDRYCNCSTDWFGTQCQYSFFYLNKTATFDDIIRSQFSREGLDTDHILRNPSLVTCYEGLRCKSMICLDWRQLCDGSMNCENGEDEPEECLLLETNECDEDEHRCRSGMCIPKTFLIDFSFDCMDLSDEAVTYLNWAKGELCHSAPALTCDFRWCDRGYFSCGDGQCVDLSSAVHSSWCHSRRDELLRHNLLLSTKRNDSDRRTNVNAECRDLMLCISTRNLLYITHFNRGKCKWSSESVHKKQCLEDFQKFCPISFFFQNENDLLYPFVQFLYHNTPKYSSRWWLPTHICYNQTQCPSFPIVGSLLIDGLTCIETVNITDMLKFVGNYGLLFSACKIHYTSALADDRQLFYCNRSRKFISKYRISDLYSDCFYDEDEYLNSTMINTLNLTYHFKCKTTNQWLPRPIIGHGHCQDYSDTLYIGSCEIESDIGCPFLRGLYSSPISYVFQENCNGILKMRHFTDDNETDETNCDEWPWPRNRRCDGYWDLSNGEDELYCSNTILSNITHSILKCSINEHYCMHDNGTIGCLSKERTGDNVVDCVGATDERATSCAFLNPLNPFECFTYDCIKLSALSDGYFDCPDREDELMTPKFFDCAYPDFTCRDGNRCLPRTSQCDGTIDCRNGEDEMFCDLDYRRITQFSMDKIDEYPLVVNSRDLMITRSALHSPASASINVRLKNEIVNPLDAWACNRGIIVKTRSLNIQCLCPPSYYGPRCEYQAERLLITVRIDVPTSLNGYQNQYNAIRLVARLILDSIVVHHEQLVHVALMKLMFYLNYPRPPPKPRGNWSVRLDAFLVTPYSVDFKASWLFKVPLSFLPVNQLVLHLMLQDQDSCNTLTCIHGICRKYLNKPHREYCDCEQNWSGDQCNVTTMCPCAGGGKCVERQPTSICVCPLGRMGNECQALFDPCIGIKCQNGGTCLPLDERQSTKLFICSCRNGYFGSYCELAAAKIEIHFSNFISSQNPTLSAAIFVHFLELQSKSPGILFLQNRLLVKQIRLNKPVRVFNNNQKYLSSFVLLQVFFEPNKFGYYIGAIIKGLVTNVTTKIQNSNRCPHVNELLFNETIRQFAPVKKVKYYSRICEMSNVTKCFHDEAYLCFCNKNQVPDCLFFQQEPTQCITDHCKHNGRCVQNNFKGVWDFGCVCSGCAYGSLCQLTTSQYSLSLDTMLGQDILEDTSLKGQPFLIKLVLAAIILMLSFGFLSNMLSLVTFKQSKVQEVGCGVYLFCLPIVGQLGLSIFAGRFFFLLGTQIYNVDNRSTARLSCICLEYLLSVCSMLFDWLTACIAVERSINVVKGISFDKNTSVWMAKWVISLLIIVVLGSSWHELLIHQLIDDPRVTAQHPWCVIVFPWSWLEYYRLIINLINLIVPCFVNLIATVFLLHKSTQIKRTCTKTVANRNGYFKVLKKQLPLYGSPLGVIVLSLMRLIFSFTLVCIVYQWQKYIYLAAYFISFIPLMGTFPMFVLPADIYKIELKKVFERIRRQCAIRKI